MAEPPIPKGSQILESIIIRKAVRVYLGVWFMLVILAVIEAYVKEPAKFLPSALVLALVGLGFAGLFVVVAKKVRDTALRRTLLCLIGYHALLGPVFLIYAITTDVSRNSDIPLRMYPHVVKAISSLD